MTVVRIPGKVMLSGEYAVLAGERALAVTIDRALTTTVVWSAENATDKAPLPMLSSNLWQTSRVLHDGDKEPLAQAVRFCRQKTGRYPVSVDVKSDLDIRYGLGSSSALRLGICLGFYALDPVLDAVQQRAEEDAYLLQHGEQSLASGYDILTQSRGGLVLYQPATAWPGETLSWSIPPGWHSQIHLVGGGKGAPTGALAKSVAAWLASTDRTPLVAEKSRVLTDALLAASSDQGAWSQVYRACGEHRRLFCGAPEEPRDILAACERLPGIDREWSIKTTGAGGEDALLLFGEMAKLTPVLKVLASFGWERLPLTLSERGAEVTCH